MKHGTGVYKWVNGSSYSGLFNKDKKHGKGEIRYINGKVAKLEWNNGVLLRRLEQDESVVIVNGSDMRTGLGKGKIDRSNSKNSTDRLLPKRTVVKRESQPSIINKEAFKAAKRPTNTINGNLINVNKFHNLQKRDDFESEDSNMLPTGSKDNLVNQQHRQSFPQKSSGNQMSNNRFESEGEDQSFAYSNKFQPGIMGKMHERTERPMTHKQASSHNKNNQIYSRG